GLARVPRVWLIRILLLLGIALVWIALVGIALILVLRIGLLRAAARHARRWPWRRPKQGFERVEELRCGGQHAERRPCRDRRGDEAGDATQSGHQVVLKKHCGQACRLTPGITRGEGRSGGVGNPPIAPPPPACCRRGASGSRPSRARRRSRGGGH